MKTKANIIKFIAGLFLIAMVHSVAISQGNGTLNHNRIFSREPGYNKTVKVENHLDIHDWMLDDLAFIFRSENSKIEDWMVKMDNNSSGIKEDCLNVNWFNDFSDSPRMDLVYWMINDSHTFWVDMPHDYLNFDDLEITDWMVNKTNFVVKDSDDETVKLYKWMLTVDNFGVNFENEIVIEDWMIDMKRWN